MEIYQPTPKDKANELLEKMLIGFIDWTEFVPMSKNNIGIIGEAKKRVLIITDEIIDVIEFMAESDESNKLPFWKQVKIEIENL